MKKIIFKGSGTAIITPFDNGKIDYSSFKNLIKFQIDNGTDAIIVCGTTGEAPTLTDNEHIDLIKFAVKTVNGKIPVIAGTGSNCTQHSVYMTKEAQKAGANAILSVTPYYNKCTDEGLYLHYSQIAKSTNLPIILYNVPSRTSVNIKVEVLKRLESIDNIVAVKEASSNISQIAEISAFCNELKIYSGNDNQTIPIMSLGGIGVISVLSNIMPAEIKKLTDLIFAGKMKESLELNNKLIPLINLMFSQINPIPVKTALSLLGYCKDEIRMPLTNINSSQTEVLKNEMKKLNLI